MITATQFPIRDGEMTTVYDVPYSNLYEVHATDFMGAKKVFETHAYTDKLLPNDGKIDMVIKGKKHGGFSRHAGYPYNFIHNDVLFSFKRHKFEMGNEFGVNFDLFALDFALVVVLNFNDDAGTLFIASRDEWTQNGRLDVNGEEVQVFLPVSNNRTLPLPAAQVLLDNPDVQQWMRDCQ